MTLPPKFQKALADFSLVAARRIALTTESSYRTWIVKYLAFLDTPAARAIAISERKFEVFLSTMAREDYSNVSQDQAFNAVIFLYRHVFKKEMADVNALRCRKKARERYTPTQAEIMAMLHELRNTPNTCQHPRTGKTVRWCIGTDPIQRAVKAAAERAGVEGKVTPHCLRHSFVTHLLDSGQSIKRVAEAVGHTDIRTTAGYARKECLGMTSPLDSIIIPFPRSKAS